MKHIFIILFFFSIHLSLVAQNEYRYSIDLTHVSNDKIKVTLACPKIKETKAVFIMPKVIPGTYSLKEYGRFLSEVKGYDANGKLIKVQKKKNLFYINKGADRLVKLEYLVDDTWDDRDLTKFIFQPGGSNIEAGKNFVINHHAFEGYFEGYKDMPFKVEIIKPDFMFGSTALKMENINKSKDLLTASNYVQLVDNPVMYCKPDTASFFAGNARIYTSVYSVNGIVKADSISKWFKPLVASLKNFMGELPVKEYHFILYFATDSQVVKTTRPGLSGYGALEHNLCSFYFLPEMKNQEDVKEMVLDVAAHEFLHTLTPLNLHSREIADFNFKDPKMSQHLWLYEGVTEYFSWLVRVQNGLVSEEDFIKEIKDKLKRAEAYGLFSYTEMSKNVLLPEYQAKYSDVYQKGAVTAMLLDQLLLKKSSGKYGLKHLIIDLMKKYGPEKPFDDDQLFADIISMTYPEVGDFINRYYKVGEALPMIEYMNWYGYDYIPYQEMTCYYVLGGFSYNFNADGQLKFLTVMPLGIDLKPNDILLNVNGEKVESKNISFIVERYFMSNPSPSKLTLTILRDNTQMYVSAVPKQGRGTKKNIFNKLDLHEPMEEKMLFEAWLQGKYR
jgi:predicted metalloprotease with PDZ domain